VPVVINEFEIVVEPPEPQRGAGEEQAEPPAPNPLRPEDILAAVRVHEERMRRLRAD